MPSGIYLRTKQWKWSPEACEKHSERLKGNKNATGERSLEARHRMSESHIGKTLTIEQRQHLSESLIGKKKSSEHCQNISKGRQRRKDELGYINSPETCQKISKSMVGQRVGEKNPAWKGGWSRKDYPLGWNRTHKEQIRQRDGYKCQICGVPEAECIRKLYVHHIDYIKGNIDPRNLISCCPKCHGRTGSNREYWKEFLSERKLTSKSSQVAMHSEVE